MVDGNVGEHLHALINAFAVQLVQRCTRIATCHFKQNTIYQLTNTSQNKELPRVLAEDDMLTVLKGEMSSPFAAFADIARK